MPYITLNDCEYELATSLRVAYKIQGQHNHKPYAEIFKSVADMGIEQQVGMLYAAFDVANPNNIIQKKEFLDHMLDNYNLKEMIDLLQSVIAGMMGKDVKDLQEQPHTRTAESADEDSTEDPFGETI